MDYNVVLVSGVQQSVSIMRIHISVLFQSVFPYRLLQSVEFPLLYTRSLMIRDVAF